MRKFMLTIAVFAGVVTTTSVPRPANAGTVLGSHEALASILAQASSAETVQYREFRRRKAFRQRQEMRRREFRRRQAARRYYRGY